MKIRGWGLVTLLFLIATDVMALTADELIAKNIEAKGGIDKIRAIQTLRLTGKVHFGGDGFSIDMNYVRLTKRPGMVRTEITWQGLTEVVAYDGDTGWQVEPFGGRRDPEKMSADDAKELKLMADLDGQLIDYQAKGCTVEYLGTEDVDGTAAHKLKVTLKGGDIRFIYLDPDYFLEIRMTDLRKVRGAIVEQETDLGNYEQVNGVMLPLSIESGRKGRPKGQKITIEKAEANVDLAGALFHFPTVPAVTGK